MQPSDVNISHSFSGVKFGLRIRNINDYGTESYCGEISDVEFYDVEWDNTVY